MLYGYGVLSLFVIALVVYCVLNIITTPDSEVRNLPKLLWLVLCLFFPIIGCVAWRVAGRPQGPSRSVPYKGNRGIPPEYDRPGRALPQNPDDDEAILKGLRDRAEEQRKRAAERARELRQQEDEAPPP